MKRLLLVILGIALGTMTANAQLGNALQRAARKVAEKSVERAIDRATDAAANAAEQEANRALGLDQNEPAAQPAAEGEEVTYESLMLQAAELPTAEQLVSHKTYELREQSLKLMLSPVSKYLMNVASLSAQAMSLAYVDIDSAQAEEMAYRLAETSTGLSREELKAMENMSDAEQEAYLAARYRQGTYEAAVVKEAENLSKLLEPLQPQIDRWTAAGEKAERMYEEYMQPAREIYAKYAKQLSTAEGAALVDVQLRYYSEVAPYLHDAVKQAMMTIVKKQLPIALEIEQEMAKLRAKNPDAVTLLLNYPQQTVTVYFAYIAHLLEIPEFYN